MTTTTYGNPPALIAYADLSKTWDEYTHRMYLPIQIPESTRAAHALDEDDKPFYKAAILPADVAFARPLIETAIEHEAREHGAWWTHIYLTVRMGYATPGNPLNRPGWHADGFGTEDINYVWTDRYPTEFAVQQFDDVPEDDQESLQSFDEQIEPENIITHTPGLLMRLDSSVIHRAPEIPAPGGERRFLKVSFSQERYNLKGNAHNHLIQYDWTMHDRQAARNVTNGDSVEAEK